MERTKSEHVDLRFEADVNAIKADATTDIDQQFALVRAPFTGRFYFEVGGKDIMPNEPMRRMFPFAYVGWLVGHPNAYTAPITSVHDRSNPSHIFANSLGDASPNIRLHREDDKVVITPQYGPRTQYEVDTEVFGKAVSAVSSRAYDTLSQNQRFKNSKFAEFLKSQ